jgi:signal transduction histidine kinase
VLDNGELQLLTRYGTRLDVLYSMREVTLGGVPHRLSTAIDITKRKQAEEALRLANAQTHAYAARLQEIREEERSAIAREIHDVLAQELTRLKLDMAWFDRRLAGPVDATLRETLRERLREVNALLDASIRTVQRIATELRPVILDNLGLYAAIEWLIGDFAKRTGIKYRISVAGRQELLRRDQATAFFRILQECLTNVVRHAEATEVDVNMREAGAALILTVTDNGKGIAPEALNDLHSIGLLGMRERAMAFGGRVEIGPAPGNGTRVIARIPLAEG